MEDPQQAARPVRRPIYHHGLYPRPRPYTYNYLPLLALPYLLQPNYSSYAYPYYPNNYYSSYSYYPPYQPSYFGSPNYGGTAGGVLTAQAQDQP